jgi:hypothetical protein
MSDELKVIKRSAGTRRFLIALWVLCVSVVQILAACQPATLTSEALPAVQAKLLATVAMSPTPNDAEQQATRLANRPTETVPTGTPAPSPTVYVGVFLDGSNGQIDDIPYNLTLAPLNPIVQPTECPIPIDDIFGTTWTQNFNAQQALGCPVEVVIPFDGTVQVFERGVMYYQPNGIIWAIAPGGALGGKYWASEQQLPPIAESDQAVPPEGLFVPALGFGAFWYGVAGVRETIGFAQTQEQSANISYQRFEGGTLLADGSSGQVFVMVGGDKVFGPY